MYVHMLVRKLLALFKYITKRNFAYLMGIEHTQRLCISFLEPLLVYMYIFFNFSKSISDSTFIVEIFWLLYLKLEEPTIIRRLQIFYSFIECQLIIY
jgi:hypothetical protein